MLLREVYVLLLLKKVYVLARRRAGRRRTRQVYTLHKCPSKHGFDSEGNHAWSKKTEQANVIVRILMVVFYVEPRQSFFIIFFFF